MNVPDADHMANCDHKQKYRSAGSGNPKLNTI